MKNFDINWATFIWYAVTWDRWSRASQKVFLSMNTATRQAGSAFGNDLQPLIEAKLLRFYTNGQDVRVHDDAREFNRALRGMSLHSLFVKPNHPELCSYLRDNFTRFDIESMSRGSGDYYSDESSLADLVASDQWLRGCLVGSLAGDLESWETQRMQGSASMLWRHAGAAAAVRSVLGKAGSWTAPLPFRDLPAQFPELTPENLGVAIGFCVRYLLLFPALRPDDLTPVIGLCPSVGARLRREPASAPAVAAPSETFHLAYRLEIMTTLLVAAAGQGLRIRGSDQRIFEKQQQEIVANLPDTPDWLETLVGPDLSQRIADAQHMLQQLKFIARKGHAGKNLRIEQTEAGERWLANGAADQLKMIFRQLRPLEGISPQLSYLQQNDRDLRLPESLAAAFRTVPADSFVGLEDFLRWRSETGNPYLEKAARSGAASVRLDWSHRPPTGEQMEARWRQILSTFFENWLLPFGGVKTGFCVSKTGQLAESVCFTLTDVGRFLIGAVDDFECERPGGHDQQVVVQPNFDVVFLGPSPLAESMLARLAERQGRGVGGRGVGALFKITKAAILKAAASGVTSDQVLETLRGVSAKELPANVVREISGWFASCRRISVKTTILIHCPDAPTAARVVAVSGGTAKRLTETVVELHGQKNKPNLVKKLQADGIFVTTGPTAASAIED